MRERNIAELSTRCQQLHIAAEALDWLHENGVISTNIYMKCDANLWTVRATADNILSTLQLEVELEVEEGDFE